MGAMASASERSLTLDCVVLGGGPAGTAIAGLLARWGRRVALLHLSGEGGGLAEETLVPGASSVIERLGFTDCIQSAGQIGLPRQGSLWEGEEFKWRDLNEENRGWQVRRGELDERLRGTVAEAGVEVIEVSKVLGPLADGEPVRAQRRGGEDVEIHAEVTVCATGRTTPSSLVDHEVVAELPTTICVHARVQDTAREREGSVIEAVQEGWLWWLPSTEGGANLALFADSEEVRELGREEVWQRAIRGARGPAAGIELESVGGTITTPTFRRSLCEALLVGDAAATVDPLSSQGIEKAFASAEDAAYSVNTILEAPELTEAVREERHAWDREVFRAHARTTLENYARVERFTDAPFWARRRTALEEWTQARHVLAPGARLTPSDKVSEVATLKRKSRRLVEATGLQLSRDSQTLRELHGIEVGALMHLFDTPRSVSATIELAGKDARFCASSRAGLSLAIEELVARGFLVEAP